MILNQHSQAQIVSMVSQAKNMKMVSQAETVVDKAGCLCYCLHVD